MAQAKKTKKRPQTARRQTAKQKADQAQRVKLSKKMAEEIQGHNNLATAVDKAKEELQQRRGRIAMLQEQLGELGGAVPEIMESVVAPDEKDDDEKE